MAEKKVKKVKVYRSQTHGEEIANAVSHGVCAYLILAASPVITLTSYKRAGALGVVSTSIFIISIFTMFFGSMLYHAMAPNSKHKEVMHILDHIFIFVAIAGTYTPIALVVVQGWEGWVIFGIQWVAVLWGILYKALFDKKSPKALLLIYLIMGWAVVIFGYAFINKANTGCLLLVLLGGIFYSLGSYFYKQKQIKYTHLVWHLFVFFGAASHYLALTLFL